MSLKNQVVYIQFHPVAYMVKLNIELSMASLITKIARGTVDDRNNEFIVQSSSHNHSHINHKHSSANHAALKMKSGTHTSAVVGKQNSALRSSNGKEDDWKGIRTLREVDVRVENMADITERPSLGESGVDEGFDGRKKVGSSEDELPLQYTTMPPKSNEGW
jgi:hypothetical protein